MAVKDSETLQAGTPYALGEYSFNCVFDDSPTLGQFARASMTKDGQTAYKTVSIPNASQISGWTVEANETEASVYAVVRTPTGDEKSSDLNTYDAKQPILCSAGGHYGLSNGKEGDYFFSTGSGLMTFALTTYYNGLYCIYASEQSGSAVTESRSGGSTTLSRSFTYKGKTVYYAADNTSYMYGNPQYISCNPNFYPDGRLNPSSFQYDFVRNVAWTIIYGKSSGEEYEEEELLVGRFAIELKDAGGVGPGSGWTDPGDYDEDWEEGDPTHTLYVTVTGALSGRHNDPIEDPSYSYIPADKDTVKDYGCGGDGGHGGGGGAGASTVVIHKFATNQANSKEVTVIARRHGYGSGGGKGGKGGDGCILVYY